MNEVRLKHDDQHDVLYARRDGARIAKSREAPGDGYLILNLDEQGSIVGVQFMFPTDLSAEEWAGHPDRQSLPHDIDSVLNAWFAARRLP